MIEQTVQTDALVVGSGFGGAVTAARLAQAGFSVTVLERGRRWRPGDFPRTPLLNDGWLWARGRGLYDVRWLRSMISVQAAGWGGGSLAYANVFARPVDQTLDDRWTADVRRAGLDRYYDLAASMLEVTPVQTDPSTGRVPDRTATIEGLSKDMGIASATFRPNLAVRFGDPLMWQPNRFGSPQRGCTFSGDCVAGCNQGAKNSLDHNYLAVAEAHGAQSVTDAEVIRLEQDGDAWAVKTRSSDGTTAHWRARYLFLAAGAVASTELLLRARDVDGTLPLLSRHLGTRFSGNGDYLAMSNLRHVPGDLTTGPTITTTTILDVWERSRPVWFQLQDGAVPLVVSELLHHALPLRRLRQRWRRLRGFDNKKTVALLSMGHDAGSGRLTLDRHGALRLRWINRRQARLYAAEERVGPAVARLLKSRVHPVATWSLLRTPVTVHALGGVPVGTDRNNGVVGHDRQVHGYPGLYVMDGAALPGSTGVNPSATILATAERAIELFIRTTLGNPHWQAPEMTTTRPLPVPEDAASAWMQRRRYVTEEDGVTIHETIREVPLDRPGAGCLDVTLSMPSLARFNEDPLRHLDVTGTLSLADLPGTHAVTGTFQLFPPGRDYLMRYDLRFVDGTEREWTAVGVKKQVGRGILARYRSTTRVALTVRAADGTQAFTTHLRILPLDVVRNGASVRGTGFTFLRRRRAFLRFAAVFTRDLISHSPRSPRKDAS
ncbi:GMC oxidoreductase [Microbacterium sp. Yaish 1]|uniref:GMC oxidoreductase n=1 Tax=Microbacterium sp. Yaish 1 TaxID=2025014 RepID=UPI0015C600BC|nr:GMC family oxidoreductase [Microbacterium sp. Yaish 1]